MKAYVLKDFTDKETGVRNHIGDAIELSKERHTQLSAIGIVGDKPVKVTEKVEAVKVEATEKVEKISTQKVSEKKEGNPVKTVKK